jgi:hypothetical protein
MIRDKPLSPSRDEVFGFKRLHIGYSSEFDALEVDWSE